jgi:hypothetical protein
METIGETKMRKSNFALRLQPSQSYFRERAGRADIAKALDILSRAGKGNPPVKGDELAD